MPPFARTSGRFPALRAPSLPAGNAARDQRRAREFVRRGDTLRAAGRAREAAECYRQAIAYDAARAAGFTGLGLSLWKLDRREDAIAALEQGVARDPNGFEPARALADAYYHCKQPMAAIKYYLQAAAANQSCTAVFSNLGALLRETGHPREALGALSHALRLDPSDANALNNSGLAFHDLGDVASALACYDLAAAADPRHTDARWNRAVALLVTGDYARGWEAQESCAAVLGGTGLLRTFTQPRWDGTPLGGRRILVHAEQGIGDQLQFARFLPAVQQRGGTVVLECHPALARLFDGIAGVDELVRTGDRLPAFDVYAPIMSLPHLLATGADLRARAVPYLHAAGEPTAAARLLAESAGLRVGLVWAGEPAHANDRNRSAPLPALLPLLDVPGTRFFSLQKGTRAGELGTLPPERQPLVTDLGATFADFADTAHAVAALDLVIAVDTSVAHLAGALGTPVWLLLPFVPDWRWLREGDRTPWYPTARLFRQPAAGAWGAVVERVGAALRSAVSAGGGAPALPRRHELPPAAVRRSTQVV